MLETVQSLISAWGYWADWTSFLPPSFSVFFFFSLSLNLLLSVSLCYSVSVFVSLCVSLSLCLCPSSCASLSQTVSMLTAYSAAHFWRHHHVSRHRRGLVDPGFAVSGTCPQLFRRWVGGNWMLRQPGKTSQVLSFGSDVTGRNYLLPDFPGISITASSWLPQNHL